LPHVLSQRDRCNAPSGAGSDRIRNRLHRVRRGPISTQPPGIVYCLQGQLRGM